MDLSDRFLSKTKRAGDCLEWQAFRDPAGYGRFKLDGRSYLAHRAAWKIFRGQIPAGQDVLHRCDNRRCVELDHLFLGTHQDNMDDMKKKGRSTRGERSRTAKLREGEVRMIRTLSKAYFWTNNKIARQFGIGARCVYDIVNGKTWKHIT